MRSRLRIAASLLIISMLLVNLAGCRGKKPQSRPEERAPGGNTLTSHLKVMGFYDERQEKPNETVLKALRDHAEVINYLAPFWYQIKVDGSLMDQSDDKDFDWVKGKIKIVPLVNNHKGNDEFLHNAAARTKAINNLVKVATERGYDGWKIDFQLLSAQSRDVQTAFMSDLHKALKAKGKILAVDVIPVLQAPNDPNAYDYKGLAANSDFLVIMAYDRHSDESKPGPVAPYTWTVQVLDQFVKKEGIDPKKLVLGVAAYGYDWVEGGKKGATSIPDKEVHSLLAAQKITPKWDDKEKTNYFTYTTKAGAHEVWFEDEKSLPYRIDLARKYGLWGIALWRMGYEEDNWWQALRAELTKQAAAGGAVGGAGTAPAPAAPGAVPGAPAR